MFLTLKAILIDSGSMNEVPLVSGMRQTLEVAGEKELSELGNTARRAVRSRSWCCWHAANRIHGPARTWNRHSGDRSLAIGVLRVLLSRSRSRVCRRPILVHAGAGGQANVQLSSKAQPLGPLFVKDTQQRLLILSSRQVTQRSFANKNTLQAACVVSNVQSCKDSHLVIRPSAFFLQACVLESILVRQCLQGV